MESTNRSPWMIAIQHMLEMFAKTCNQPSISNIPYTNEASKTFRKVKQQLSLSVTKSSASAHEQKASVVAFKWLQLIINQLVCS